MQDFSKVRDFACLLSNDYLAQLGAEKGELKYLRHLLDYISHIKGIASAMSYAKLKFLPKYLSPAAATTAASAGLKLLPPPLIWGIGFRMRFYTIRC